MKNILGYEKKYAVTKEGRVWSLPNTTSSPKGRWLKPRKLPKGYLRVNLCLRNKTKDFFIHRLVATAFLPNPQKLPQVNHKDGDKTNNNVINLEWCTCSDNHRHAFKIGLKNNKNAPKGQMHWASKLTDKKVLAIRKSKQPALVLKKKYKVSLGAIYAIKSRAIWRHI